MQLTRDLVIALVFDLAGSALLVLGILGYVGIIGPLSEPTAYLTLGALGLLATAIAMPLLLRAVKAQKAARK
jgi:ABC-type Fe3+-siderophore transport system permease subunit